MRHRVAACAAGRRPTIRKTSLLRWNQERESSERPMLNAFCRVAPSVLFNFLAILAAAVFFFANAFSSRTSVAVQARRFFDFLAINPPFQERQLLSHAGVEENRTDRVDVMRIVALSADASALSAAQVKEEFC
jgi:hypothetical protein